MIYGFDTPDKDAATAALILYAIYRSRNKTRFKVTPEMWGQIERFTKDAAKIAKTIPLFMEALKPRLCCESINPRWMAIGAKGDIPLALIQGPDGTLGYAIQFAGGDTEHREFLTDIFKTADARQVVRKAYTETTLVVLLVRDRLERERPVEQNLDIIDRTET